MKDIEAFGAEVGRHQGVACRISTGVSQARDQTDTDRIAVGAEHDRDRAGGFLGGEPRRCPGRDNDINLRADQFFGEAVQEIGLSSRGPSLDDDILAVHIAELFELAHEGHGEGRPEAGIKQSDFETLLRCFRRRQYGRAAE